MQRNRIHGGHRQSGAVDDAADVAVESNIVETVAGGFDFLRVFFIKVAVAGDFRVAVDRVAVKRHFRIDREQLVAVDDGQRVDLRHQRILVAEAAVQRLHQLHRLWHQCAGEADTCSNLAALELGQADGRVNRFTHDLFRIGFSDLLDIHAAAGRGDDGDTLAYAVDDQAKIKFLRDVLSRLHQHAMYHFTGG